MRLSHLAAIAVLFIASVDPFPDDLTNDNNKFYVEDINFEAEQQPVEETAYADVSNNLPDSSSAPAADIPPEPNEVFRDVVNVPKSYAPSTTIDLPATDNVIDSQTLPALNDPLIADIPKSSGFCPNRYRGTVLPPESSDPPWKPFLDMIKALGSQQPSVDSPEEVAPQAPPQDASGTSPEASPLASPVPKKLKRGRICDDGIHQLCCEEEGDQFIVWFPRKCKKCENTPALSDQREKSKTCVESITDGPTNEVPNSYKRCRVVCRYSDRLVL